MATVRPSEAAAAAAAAKTAVVRESKDSNAVAVFSVLKCNTPARGVASIFSATYWKSNGRFGKVHVNGGKNRNTQRRRTGWRKGKPSESRSRASDRLC